jgi:hypothetical protein
VQVGGSGSQDSQGRMRDRTASGDLRSVLKIKADCPTQVRVETLKGEKVQDKSPSPARSPRICAIG